MPILPLSCRTSLHQPPHPFPPNQDANIFIEFWGKSLVNKVLPGQEGGRLDKSESMLDQHRWFHLTNLHISDFLVDGIEQILVSNI